MIEEFEKRASYEYSYIWEAINELRAITYELKESFNRIPHKCPVCDAKDIDLCRSCDFGIVWL